MTRISVFTASCQGQTHLYLCHIHTQTPQERPPCSTLRTASPCQSSGPDLTSAGSDILTSASDQGSNLPELAPKSYRPLPGRGVGGVERFIQQTLESSLGAWHCPGCRRISRSVSIQTAQLTQVIKVHRTKHSPAQMGTEETCPTSWFVSTL